MKCNVGDAIADKLRKDFIRCFEPEDLARAIVQIVLDELKLLGGDGGQIHALWKVLADEPVEVLVGGALTGHVGIAKEDVDVKTLLKEVRYGLPVIEACKAAAGGSGLEVRPKLGIFPWRR